MSGAEIGLRHRYAVATNVMLRSWSARHGRNDFNDFTVMAEEYPHITALIPELVNGDKSSWDSLVNLFSPALTGKAYVLMRGSKLNRQLSPEDLVSTTFAKAWKSHAKMRGESTYQVAKWLLTIMLNSYRDLCRKNQLPEESKASWVIPADIAETPDDDVEALEEEVKLHAVIAELEEEDRDVLVLRFWHGMTHQQIADQKGRSKAAIVRQLQRVIPRLNKAMR